MKLASRYHRTLSRTAGLSFLVLLEQLLDPFGRFVGRLLRGHVLCVILASAWLQICSDSTAE